MPNLSAEPRGLTTWQFFWAVHQLICQDPAGQIGMIGIPGGNWWNYSEGTERKIGIIPVLQIKFPYNKSTQFLLEVDGK